MDPITLAVGGGLLIVGYLAGRLTGRRRRAEPKPVAALCDCGHSLAMHDPADNACHGQIPRADSYGERGEYLGTQYHRCTCRRYVGPQPLEEFIAPRYLPPAS